jgi:hypothetical protein
VTDLSQADADAEVLGEAAARVQAALPQLDVRPIGELDADTAQRLAGGSAGDPVSLQQDHVGSTIRRVDAHAAH